MKAIVHNALLGTGKEFDLKKYDDKSPEETVREMIDIANKKLGIPKFFYTDDITDQAVPQERLIVPWLLAVKATMYQQQHHDGKGFPKVDNEPETEPEPEPEPEPETKTNEFEVIDLPPTQTITTDLPLPSPPEEEEPEVEPPNTGVNTTDDINTSGSAIKRFIATEKEQREKCKACDKQFKKESIVIVNGDLYHDDCFVCFTCKSNFTKFYWSWEGKPYCFDHYQVAAKLFCRKCNEKISDELVVLAMGSKW